MSGPRRSMAWAGETLRRLMMPEAEIRAALATDDPVTLRRYLELHEERLQERVREQQRVLGSLERSLTEDILERCGQVPVGARTSI